MTKEFHSNGKLLISGEYAVLDGAISLAIPTKYGQTLKVTPHSNETLIWKSFDEKNVIWFEGKYDMQLNELHTSLDEEISATLIKILKVAQQMNPDFLKDVNGCTVETKLEFARDWGLGSSSTLINNIAQWARVDAFELLWRSFQGSGYDIACAQHNSPITYQLLHQKPIVHQVDFDPPFKNQLYFVYLNQKMNSRKAIQTYKKRKTLNTAVLTTISEISRQMIYCTELARFDELIAQHEAEMEKVLGITMVQKRLFSDYNGKIKSLGAWGGDFVLATGNYAPEYFKEKGFDTIIPYTKMVL